MINLRRLKYKVKDRWKKFWRRFGFYKPYVLPIDICRKAVLASKFLRACDHPRQFSFWLNKGLEAYWIQVWLEEESEKP